MAKRQREWEALEARELGWQRFTWAGSGHTTSSPQAENISGLPYCDDSSINDRVRCVSHHDVLGLATGESENPSGLLDYLCY